MTILKIFIIMHFLAVVLKIRSNPTHVLTRISVEARTVKKKIIWFNPPYSSNVSANTGKSFLTILERHFLKSHKLYKFFNQNNA